MGAGRTWVVALGAVLVLATSSSTTPARGAKVGHPAPDFSHAAAAEAAYTFVVFPDAREIAKRFRVSMIPTVVVVDRDGTVLLREKGTDPATLDRLRETVAAAIERRE